METLSSDLRGRVSMSTWIREDKSRTQSSPSSVRGAVCLERRFVKFVEMLAHVDRHDCFVGSPLRSQNAGFVFFITIGDRADYISGFFHRRRTRLISAFDSFQVQLSTSHPRVSFFKSYSTLSRFFGAFATFLH